MIGVLRGKYLSPIFGVKVGETAIRNCLRDQLKFLRDESLRYMGNHPLIFTEIGIPYDMDDKHAYKTGDYSSQIRAMDANHFALEGSTSNGFTLWLYSTRVSLLFSGRHYTATNTSGRMTMNGEIIGMEKTCRFILMTIWSFQVETSWLSIMNLEHRSILSPPVILKAKVTPTMGMLDHKI